MSADSYFATHQVMVLFPQRRDYPHQLFVLDVEVGFGQTVFLRVRGNQMENIIFTRLGHDTRRDKVGGINFNDPSIGEVKMGEVEGSGKALVKYLNSVLIFRVQTKVWSVFISTVSGRVSRDNPWMNC